jgi:hypothetical protein
MCNRKKLYQPKKAGVGRGQNPALRQLVVDAGGLDPIEAIKRGQIYKGPRLAINEFVQRTYASPAAAAAAKAKATAITPTVTVVSAGSLVKRPDEEDDEYGGEYWDDEYEGSLSSHTLHVCLTRFIYCIVLRCVDR